MLRVARLFILCGRGFVVNYLKRRPLELLELLELLVLVLLEFSVLL